jgi:hypothetical protein
MGEGTADLAAQIPVLQTTRQNLVKPGPRHDAELADPRDGLREAPIGNTDAHAALNNFWKRNMHVYFT